MRRTRREFLADVGSGMLVAGVGYSTASEEFANMRQPFRWRQLTALARVTASEFGSPAAGCDAAMELLKV